MGQTVLVVDDDPLARRLVALHLKDAGYRVVAAEDGRAATEALAASEASIVVTDWEMPGLTGPELCRHLHAFEGTDRVHAIVMSTHGGEDRMAEALDAGADDYLAKPFDKRELLARVRAGATIVELRRLLARRDEAIADRNARIERAFEELARVNTKLTRMVRTDELTDLRNRRAAMRTLARTWQAAAAGGSPLACLMIDVDHFKPVNDTHGHVTGDRALVEVAHALRGSCRADEEVFRIGGDEFLVLCPRATAAMAATAAERLRGSVEKLAIEIDDEHPLRVTISVGVAEHAPEMNTVDDLVRAADNALYDAKGTGRNRVRVAPTSPHAIDADDERRRTA